jgi:hypothetical protein
VNEFDKQRFNQRVGELVEANPEAAELQRQKHVDENQPLDVLSSGEVVIEVPRGLSLEEWALSERDEDPTEIYVVKRSSGRLHVGSIRRDEVQHQPQG